MLLVDDHLARVALGATAPTLWSGRVPTVPWTFQMRLVRALRHSTIAGQLSRGGTEALIDAAISPHPSLLNVLDPRQFTSHIADLHGRRGVSLAAAELLGAAVATKGEIHVSERNFGRHWYSHLSATSVTVVVYTPDELARAGNA